MNLYNVIVALPQGNIPLFIYERSVRWSSEFWYEVYSPSTLFNAPTIGYHASDFGKIVRKIFPNGRAQLISKKNVEDLTHSRIQYLINGAIPVERIGDFFGLTQPELNSLVMINPYIRLNENTINKWEIEETLQKQNIYTRREMALEFGLYERDLDKFFAFIKDKIFYSAFIPDGKQSFFLRDIKDLVMNTLFPNIIFESQAEFLDALFTYLNDENDLKIQRCFCFISKSLKEKDKKNPAYIDVLMNLPVSEEFSIAIKNDKPGYLSPDYISFYPYLLFEEELREYKLFPDRKDFEKCLDEMRKMG